MGSRPDPVAFDQASYKTARAYVEFYNSKDDAGRNEWFRVVLKSYDALKLLLPSSAGADTRISGFILILAIKANLEALYRDDLHELGLAASKTVIEDMNAAGADLKGKIEVIGQ